MKAWRGEGDFLTELKKDPEVGKYLNEKELAANFDLDFHFAHVDAIFRRVFTPRRRQRPSLAFDPDSG